MKGTAALLLSLEVAVPIWIAELMNDVLLWSRVEEWRREGLDAIASCGDVLMYGGKRGEAAEVFNHLARALAAMAFLPGGVTFAGMHFEAAPPTDAEAGVGTATFRPVADVLPDLDRWLDRERMSPERPTT